MSDLKLSDPDTTASRSRNSQAETVATELTLAIHQYRILPGTKLGEDELAEIFGVSRTIIRSALQSLWYYRLVENQRNRGGLCGATFGARGA